MKKALKIFLLTMAVTCASVVFSQVAMAATTTLSVIKSGNGYVGGGLMDCGSTCSMSYGSGTFVTLTATADAGYTFSSWADCDSVSGGTGENCNVSMDFDRSVKAYFNLNASPSFTVSANVPTNGYVTSIHTGGGPKLFCPGGACSVSNVGNYWLFVFANPNNGYQFNSWGAGACLNKGQVCQIWLTGDTNVGTATFSVAPTYTLSLTNSGGGTVSSNPAGINCTISCSYNFSSGTSVTLTAAASAGYTFTGWSGACTGTGTCTVIMNAAKAVTATFSIASTYTLSLTNSGGGTVTSNPAGINCTTSCNSNFSNGASVTLTAAASAGYTFSGWSGTGGCTGTGTCTVTMTSPKAVTATFTGAPGSIAANLGTPADPCWDILYEGLPVLVNGLPNSGVVQFDPTVGSPVLPAPGNEACLQMSDTLAVIDAKGWFWDTNLGWISMYCADEDEDGASPYTNRGIPCGDYKYGVRLVGFQDDGLPYPDIGLLSGFAWGDNTGYISFNCQGPPNTCGTAQYNIKPSVDGLYNITSSCTGYVNKPLPCTPNGPGISHAWSDNVGWINFTGVKFPLFELIEAILTVTLTITPDPATVTKSDAPLADGTDAYKIDLKISAVGGFPINPDDYEITIVPVWEKDSVTYDQTATTAVDCKSSLKGVNCAVSKPLTVSDFGVYEATDPMSFTAYVTSDAPTTSMNGMDADGNGTVDFSYEDFSVLPTGVSKPPSHDLILKSVMAKLVRKSDHRCSFGAIDPTTFECDLRDTGDTDLSLGFVPGIEVTELNDSVNGDTIAASYLKANDFTYSILCRDPSVCDSNVEFKTSAGDPFELVFNVVSSDDTSDRAGAECKDPNFVTIPTLVPSGIFSMTPVFKASSTAPYDCQTSGPETVKDPTVYSIVRDGAAAYYSNKLPRKTGSLIYNPVAHITGSVYSSGVSNPQTDSTYRSLGDISTNVLREQIARNVYNLIGGVAAVAGTGSITISGYNGTDGFVGSSLDNLSKLQLDGGGLPKVYYSNGNDVIFAQGGVDDITWQGERTLIVIGADVYINSNLYVDPSTITPPKPKLGIIVLKDETFKKGGNIYIAPNVTNIQANIYADGSLFSYDTSPGFPRIITSADSHYGEPFFEGEKARSDLLVNQLYIEGSIASQNTIGGAVYSPKPILGDGSLEAAGEGKYGIAPEGRSRARLYDLNFLRYYGMVYERMPAGSACEGEAKDQQNPTLCPTPDGYALGYEITASPVLEGGDLVQNPAGMHAQGLDDDKNSAEYILFDPPTANLPGFGVSTGANVNIGPQ